jgi:DNA-binding SARP family transcriptional activator
MGSTDTNDRRETPVIRFTVLGPLAMHVDGTPVDLPGAVPRQVLAVLVARSGAALTADAIADHLWPSARPRTARKYVQVTIYRLRRLPGLRDRIVLAPQGYLLRLERAECDALVFTDEVTAAAELLERGDAAAAEPVLATALGRWRGKAYDGVEHVGPVGAEADCLTELRLTAVEDLTDARLRLGRHRAVLDELTRTVPAHRFRERLRGQLMLALYRSGRSADALEEYRAARRALADELGVEPGPQLQELHRLMLRHDPQLLPEAGDARVAGGRGRPVPVPGGRPADADTRRQRR